jgi:hypothetical protein
LVSFPAAQAFTAHPTNWFDPTIIYWEKENIRPTWFDMFQNKNIYIRNVACISHEHCALTRATCEIPSKSNTQGGLTLFWPVQYCDQQGVSENVKAPGSGSLMQFLASNLVPRSLRRTFRLLHNAHGATAVHWVKSL